MKLLLISDAWMPQVNGVVTTLVELVRELKKIGLQVTVVHPGLFKTRPCPGYAGIDLAVKPAKQLAALMVSENFDAVHIATDSSRLVRSNSPGIGSATRSSQSQS
ncbi:MAG: GDP-mannose-dependent alpha-mannosyltransferase [Pseudomonadota bacterium]|jgi:hypothetical protein